MYCFRVCVRERERESALALSAVSDFLFPLVVALKKSNILQLVAAFTFTRLTLCFKLVRTEKNWQESETEAKVLGKIKKGKLWVAIQLSFFLFTWHLNKHTQDLLFDSQHHLPGRDTDVNILRCNVCTFLKFALRQKSWQDNATVQ